MKKWKTRLNIMVTAMLCALILFFCATLFIFIKVEVPTASMYPTIQLYDKLFVVRDTDLQRGDIAVFFNKEVDLTLVKRTIGLPGDKISIVEGVVFINGQELDEPYIQNHSYEDLYFEVPENCYFFMGDNRSASADARVWNDPYIDKSNIIGKAVFRFYPASRLGVIE